MANPGTGVRISGLVAAALIGAPALGQFAIDRVSAAEKGSLLVFPSVELRFSDDGSLLQDTFLTLVNDYGEPVEVQLFLVNGDPPLEADGGERAHPGWNWITATIALEGDAPVYWSLLDGMPAGSGGVAPFTTLDPGPPAGRPAPDGSTDRVLRGHAYAWAVNADGVEINWNHLSGTATTVDYSSSAVARSNAFAYRALAAPLGAPTGTPGELRLDGMEFDAGYDRLLMDFQAVGSGAFSGDGDPVTTNTQLALLTVAADLRLDAGPPVTTRAQLTVWNENAVKFTGAARCVTWWAQDFLGAYDDQFLVTNLQTDHGWARIDAVASAQCETQGGVSQPAALVGVSSRLVDFGSSRDVTAVALRGDGSDTNAVIRYDVFGQPPESPPVSGIPAAPDRASVSDEGSVLIFPNVEVRWDAAGNVIQDTFITLENHSTSPVLVRIFLSQGDPPLAEDLDVCERAHDGHNQLETMMLLNAEQPTHWSALTGLPANGGVPPFAGLDPGVPDGRPDTDGTPDRVLRGSVYVWAATSGREEISWNHLGGGATIVDYRAQTAWEYGATAFKSVDEAVPTGSPTGTPGVINLDGVEFAQPYDRLMLDFPAADSSALSGPRQVVNDVDLTMLALDADFRPAGDPPVTTGAVWEVWNTNQVRLTGMSRCLTAWDQTLLSGYDAPNHFRRSILQTSWGKARVDGRAGEPCDVDAIPDDGPLGSSPLDVISEDAALIGTALVPVVFDAFEAAAGGTTLPGMGLETAVIRTDLTALPPAVEPCPPDVDGDGEASFADILDIIITWGPCCLCPQDVDGDGDVAFSDILLVIINWGPC